MILTAETLAGQFDKSLAIEAGWAAGNNKRFEKWLSRFSTNLNPANSVMYDEDGNHEEHAQSTCGGGSEAVDWYPVRWHGIDVAIVGLSTTRNAWIVPTNETMPEITKFKMLEN
jgi:hypothetical protein